MYLFVYGLILVGTALVVSGALGLRRPHRRGGGARRRAARRLVPPSGSAVTPARLGGRSRSHRALWPWTAAGLVAAGFFAGAFYLLLDDVTGREHLATVDSRVASWLVAHRVRWLTSSMLAATNLGAVRLLWLPLLAITAYLATSARRPDAAFLLVAASAGTWVLVGTAKLLVARARPEVGQMLVGADGYAFPSGHAAQGVATYGALAYLAGERAARRWRMLAWAAAIAVAGVIGFSRVYLGAHWLTDVLGGWALGMAALVLLITSASTCHRVHRAAERQRPEPAPPAESCVPISQRETVRLR